MISLYRNLLTVNQSRTNQDPTFFEENWSSLLETLSSNISVPTLQCLVLAQMYCMTKADYQSLLRYRSLGVSVCQQLGLHRSQKNVSSNVLAVETRKKVFWCQYVMDRYVNLPFVMACLTRSQIRGCTNGPSRSLARRGY